MEEKIPEGWKKVKLKEICKITTGKLDANAMCENGKYVFFTCAEKTFLINDYAFDTEAVLISGNGANLGYVHYYKGKFNAYQRTYVLYDFKCNAMFVKYQIEKNIKKRIYMEKSVSNTPYIVLSTIADMEIYVPTENKVQEEIVKIIEKNEKIIDGIHNKISYNKKLKQAIIRKIFKDNKNWKEENFQNIFSILQNNSFKRDYLNYEIGKCKNIHYGDILTKYSEITNISDSNVPYINTEIDINNYKEESFLKNGDIVIADTAEDEMVGKVTEIENVNIKVLSGLHTIACRPKKAFAKGYLGIYMNSKEYHNQLIPFMQGIKVLGINKSSIIKTKLKYPDIKEQENIVNVVVIYSKIIDKLIIKEEFYKKMEIALMQQLLTGKVRVKI